MTCQRSKHQPAPCLHAGKLCDERGHTLLVLLQGQQATGHGALQDNMQMQLPCPIISLQLLEEPVLPTAWHLLPTVCAHCICLSRK
jgi:hypothetical protein